MSAHGLLDDLLDQHRSTVALGSPENPAPRVTRIFGEPNGTVGRPDTPTEQRGQHMTEHESLQDRVNRGAEWLDAVRPEWWTEIDVATLDLVNPCRCVLGQIVTASSPVETTMSFYDVQSVVGFAWTAAHGFRATMSDGAESWAALDELWIAQIKARWSGEQVA